jgi:hypothetical protein
VHGLWRPNETEAERGLRLGGADTDWSVARYSVADVWRHAGVAKFQQGLLKHCVQADHRSTSSFRSACKADLSAAFVIPIQSLSLIEGETLSLDGYCIWKS